VQNLVCTSTVSPPVLPPDGEQSGLLTRIAATGSVSLCVRERKATIDSCLLATERAINIFRILLLSISLRG
jgi:hypothetical protein